MFFYAGRGQGYGGTGSRTRDIPCPGKKPVGTDIENGRDDTHNLHGVRSSGRSALVILIHLWLTEIKYYVPGIHEQQR